MPSLQPLASALGQSAATLGRGAATLGRTTKNIATSPTMVRNVWLPGAGATLGYGAGAGAEHMLGLESGTARNWGAGIGGLGTLLHSNPTAWNQMRYAARLEPGQSWKPLGSTFNFLTRPRYPGLEPFLNRNAPRAAPWVTGTLRKLPRVAAVGGVGYAGYEGARYLPDELMWQARDELGIHDKETLNRVWWDTFKRQPQILSHMYGVPQDSIPGIAGRAVYGNDFGVRDTTPIGDVHRSAVWNVAKPDVMYGLTRARQQHPYWMGAADTARSMTPLGAAYTLGLNKFAPKDEPDLRGAMHKILEANRGGMINHPDLTKSPLARLYADILMKPDVLTNPRLNYRLASEIPVDEIEQSLRPIADAMAPHVNQPDINQQLRGPLLPNRLQERPEGLNYMARNVLFPTAHQDTIGWHLPQSYDRVGIRPDWSRNEQVLFGGSQGMSNTTKTLAARAAVPVAGEAVRTSLGPNPTSPWEAMLRGWSNSEEGRAARANAIDNVIANFRQE